MSSVKILRSIKQELKARGLLYKDIAMQLKMTEAGVKKFFAKDDISFNKLKLICDLLQISPQDLLNTADASDVSTHRFSENQIRFFLNHPNYFHFFMKLAYEQATPQTIQKNFNLSLKSVNTYLKKLEELGMIKRHPFDRMQIMGGIPLAINTKGTDLEILKYDIIFHQLQVLKDRKSDATRGAGLYLTPEEENEFLETMTKTILEYSSRSRSHRRKKNERARESTYMSYFIDQSMFRNITEL